MRLLKHWSSLLTRFSPASVKNRIFKTAAALVLAFTLSISLCAAGYPAVGLIASLPQGNAVTDPKALLRLSLPIDNQSARQIQASLENISSQLRGKRWSAINGDINKAIAIVRDRPADLLASIPSDQQLQANQLIAQINTGLVALQAIAEAKDRDLILSEKSKVLDAVGDLEALMVQKYPLEVPAEYSNLPQLRGRATVVMETSKGPVTIVADGYSAPVTAGNLPGLSNLTFCKLATHPAKKKALLTPKLSNTAGFHWKF
jgi:peptidylprolyl isomerase